MPQRLRLILKALLALSVVWAASWLRLPAGAAPAPAAGALATALGAGSPSLRLDGEPQWGAASAALWDRLKGESYRQVAFLAAPPDGLPDLFTAQARRDGQGRLLALDSLTNLTRTPDGAETGLAGDGGRLAYATRVGEAVRLVTVVNLENSQRLVITLERPAAGAGLAWEPDGRLLITYAPGQVARVDPAAPAVEPPEAPLRLVVQTPGEMPWLPRLVSTVREHPWVGPEKIAFLENLYFFLVDMWDRATYRPAAVLPAPSQTPGQAQATGPPVPSATALAATATPGPERPAVGPTAAPAPSATPAAPPLPTALPTPADKRAAYLPAELGLPLRTTYPDASRPFAKAEVITIDPDRFDLHLVSGTWEPRSTTGLVGTGVIPEDEQTRKNLAAAFNGGWAAMHGAYGMMIDRQVYLPAKNGIATLAWYADGRLRLGVWGKDILPGPDTVSYRQNCLPLIENGVVSPELGKLSLWGLSISDEALIYRSGLGQTAGGKLVYVAGNALSARTLAQVLKEAGAENAMQLDIDDFHVAFVSYRQGTGADGRLQVTGTKLRQDMQGFEGLYLKPFALDFFYLTRRGGPVGGSPGPGTPQPAPVATVTPQTRPQDQATPLPLPGRIAFQSSRDGNWEIYTQRADGSGLTRLTRDPSDDLYPAWSPDGSSIAFTSGRGGNWDIYTMPAGGAAVTRLTDHPASDWYPAWSPDGRQIAFQSDREGNAEIFALASAAGPEPAVKLTRFKGNNERPTWSPDGLRLAFDSDLLDYGTVSAGLDLYVMTIGSEVTPTKLVAFAESPAWSPDGQRLAFHAQRGGNWDIFTVKADGTDPVHVTDHPADDRYAAWSPDGRWLAFGSNRTGTWEVFATAADGSGPTYRLTYGGGLHPAWGP